MQNWQKHRNYRKHEGSGGTIKYVITVDGKDVEVSEEVFEAYSQADRRERYCIERDAGRLLSLEQMTEDNVLLSYLTDKHIESAEDTAIHTMLAGQVWEAFMALPSDERDLIQALVIDGVTERDYADAIGLSQKGVNKRKQKILKSLKKMVLNP